MYNQKAKSNYKTYGTQSFFNQLIFRKMQVTGIMKCHLKSDLRLSISCCAEMADCVVRK